MSVMWASDSSSSEWGNPFDPFEAIHPKHGERQSSDTRRVIPNVDSNHEGYSGNPTSFIDISDPRVKGWQQRYEEICRENFRKSKDRVGMLIRSGVVMPTGKMMEAIVAKLKGIAAGGKNG